RAGGLNRPASRVHPTEKEKVMKRITGLMALLVAMALGTASAWAATPEVGQGNTAAVTAGNKTVTVGTGHVPVTDGGGKGASQQAINHNTVAVAAGNESEANAQGGDTTASSGNAYGGNGGNASAQGGNSNASNNAQTG